MPNTERYNEENKMRLEGTHTFSAPRQDVWAALMNPAVLASALPGAEQMEQIGENDYRAAMNVKVGPVQGRFDGKITLADIVPLQQYTLKVDGQGAPGFLREVQRLDDGSQVVVERADPGVELAAGDPEATHGGKCVTARSMCRRP